MGHLHQVDHYLRLYNVIGHAVIGEKGEVTLNEIAETLCCTQRNAQLILHKLSSLHWITWIPGRGRGNRSKIIFLREPDELLLSVAKEYVQVWDIQGATALVTNYSESFPYIRERFEMWLNSQWSMLKWEPNHLQGENILRFSYEKPFLHLDPAYGYLRSECHIIKQLFDPLLIYHPERNHVEPHLSHHWERDSTGRSWRFYLRRGVRFHHGPFLVAEDVVYSLERLERSSYCWMTENMASVTASDDYTVDILLKDADALFLQILSNEHLSIIPAHYCEEIGRDFFRFPMGTGPFKLLRNDHAMLVMEKFEVYFRERAILDRIEISIHSVGNLQKYREEDLQQWKVEAKTASNVMMLLCNLNKPGYPSDPRFREVLELLLVREKMIQELGGDRGKVTESILADHEKELVKKRECKERIEELLRQLPEQKIPLHLYTFDDRDHQEDAVWIQKQCASVGIRIELHLVSVAELLKVETMQFADIILDETTIDDLVEVSMLELFFNENSFLKHLLSEELKGFIQNRVTELRQKEHHALRLQQLIAIDQKLREERAYISLYQNHIRTFSSADVKGSSINAQGWIDYRDLWM
ncbi:DNA-binding transcriptional regulator SgrR of sgrS sRNA, contains a MarR-type HTH domain and a solute-binding domain [Marininema mesophilum]|uniref:DNA-binding transcriptional regulator SgrR of sgrS sRNA, contains a MarR-type HTH domain and a solute-binding domain n=1 Tax=Marininema mesophilum TaxID=1048340 RepID=A0A1H2S5Q7_9BACL|nr:ABC transporter substrate-binding protein [Marininema mesophilum]SDW26514.1 DNA-binding transcriptional regulator SgrR of sgrS sRNA, contains a MarR-type HTH domain and a solute-binding domain [Marininema mesophilum]